ncbi:unnamed protein product [Arabidopsis lyrata]|uniref:Uncharacterized protein n=1 Tax=Arabidopsis lyrata subsp. lyrata TaxID=81972 RepID=D7LHM0_ARALL|nr:hypothetical protein ARALYDRAFT_344517 [Arabidopsis lyrata subsp. lyrata]CAH8264018.1 unnamed protein product [Arabidopsis lyrata]
MAKLRANRVVLHNPASRSSNWKRKVKQSLNQSSVMISSTVGGHQHKFGGPNQFSEKICYPRILLISTHRNSWPVVVKEFLEKTLRLTFEEGVQILKEAGVEIDPLGDLNTESQRKLDQLVLEK